MTQVVERPVVAESPATKPSARSTTRDLYLESTGSGDRLRLVLAEILDDEDD